MKATIAGHHVDFAEAFGLPANEAVTAGNFELATFSAATDVALAFGNPVQSIVDFNLQSGPDHGLPARLLLYNAALHNRQAVGVNPVSELLRPEADTANHSSRRVYGEGRCEVEFEYKIIRVCQQLCFQPGEWLFGLLDRPRHSGVGRAFIKFRPRNLPTTA